MRKLLLLTLVPVLVLVFGCNNIDPGVQTDEKIQGAWQSGDYSLYISAAQMSVKYFTDVVTPYRTEFSRGATYAGQDRYAASQPPATPGGAAGPSTTAANFENFINGEFVLFDYKTNVEIASIEVWWDNSGDDPVLFIDSVVYSEPEYYYAYAMPKVGVYENMYKTEVPVVDVRLSLDAATLQAIPAISSWLGTVTANGTTGEVLTIDPPPVASLGALTVSFTPATYTTGSFIFSVADTYTLLLSGTGGDPANDTHYKAFGPLSTGKTITITVGAGTTALTGAIIAAATPWAGGALTPTTQELGSVTAPTVTVTGAGAITFTYQGPGSGTETYTLAELNGGTLSPTTKTPPAAGVYKLLATTSAAGSTYAALTTATEVTGKTITLVEAAPTNIVVTFGTGTGETPVLVSSNGSTSYDNGALIVTYGGDGYGWVTPYFKVDIGDKTLGDFTVSFKVTLLEGDIDQGKKVYLIASQTVGSLGGWKSDEAVKALIASSPDDAAVNSFYNGDGPNVPSGVGGTATVTDMEIKRHGDITGEIYLCVYIHLQKDGPVPATGTPTKFKVEDFVLNPI